MSLQTTHGNQEAREANEIPRWKLSSALGAPVLQTSLNTTKNARQSQGLAASSDIFVPGQDSWNGLLRFDRQLTPGVIVDPCFRKIQVMRISGRSLPPNQVQLYESI
jgi:hypothetical protein